MTVGEYKIWKGALVCALIQAPAWLISDSFFSGLIAGCLGMAAQALIWPYETRKSQ